MYNINTTAIKSVITQMPNIKKATKMNLNQYNINSTKLLSWLVENTSVKHVFKYTDETDYYIFFKNVDEQNKLIEFLGNKFKQEYAA